MEVNIHSDITGGIDTRLNLALMMRNKIDISCGIQAPIEYKNLANTGKYSEYKIASQIAAHYKLDLKVFGDDNYNKNKQLIDEITFDLSNKQTYNRRTGYFMQLRKDGIGLMVSGLSGTELFRQSYLDYFNVRKDLDLYKFLRQYVCMKSISSVFYRPKILKLSSNRASSQVPKLARRSRISNHRDRKNLPKIRFKTFPHKRLQNHIL